MHAVEVVRCNLISSDEQQQNRKRKKIKLNIKVIQSELKTAPD